MIVKMKKITVLICEKDVNLALRNLREIGVVHIKHMRTPHADYITSTEKRLALIDQTLSLMTDSIQQKKDIPAIVLTSVMKEVITLCAEDQKLKSRLDNLNRRLTFTRRLGRVSLADQERLNKAGVFVKLYQCDRGSLRRIPPDKLTYVVDREKGQVHVAFFTTDPDQSLGLPEAEIPHESLRSLGRKIWNTQREIKQVKKHLAELSAYRDCLIHYKQELTRRLEFGKVRFGMRYEEGICCLQGFCPRESVAQITQTARVEGWAIAIEEPSDPAKVPTLIRYPRWVKIIEPVFKFMGTVPGYHEYDISLWFLVFFSLFFAMLIGDAGYGLIFFAATYFFQKKLPRLPRSVFFLFYVLSFTTLAWGAISGNWFGVQGIGQLPLFRSLKVGRLDSFIDANKMVVMHLCFIIGAIHLSIAHAWRVLRYSNSWRSLAHLGWMAIVWGIYFLVSMLVLQRPFPVLGQHLLIAGAGLVILFSNPQKNIFKAVGVSLANFPLKLINSFADTLSYLRLFAIGYASVMIAVSFNQIALTVGFNSVIRTLGSTVILIAGHTLNILLGFMSVLVHGIRLNMLEFSGHLDMEWSGQEYKPFA